MIKDLCEARTDPVLFAWSRDYVGDLAETVSLLWPARRTNAGPPTITEVIDTLRTTPKADLPDIVANWLDASTVSIRYAIIKAHHRRLTGSAPPAASPRPPSPNSPPTTPPPSRPTTSKNSGTGSPALRLPLRLARGPRPQARPGRSTRLPPPDARPAARSRRHRRARPGPVPRRMEMGRHPRPTRQHRPRQAHLLPRRRRHQRDLPRDRRRHADFRRRRGRSRRRTPRHPRRRDRLRSPTSSSASTAKPPAPRCRRTSPSASASTTSCSTAPTTSAPSRSTSAANASNPGSPPQAPEPRMTLSTLIPFASMDELGEIRAGTRAASIEGLMLKRADSRLPPRPPQRPVVEVEARSPHHRRRPHVCPARQR